MQASEYENIYLHERTHGWYRGMRAISLNLLERYLPRRAGLKILDAGCGTGGMMEAMAKYGRVFGFDNSPLAIKYCQKRGLKTVRQAKVERIPYQSGSFDLVTCFDVLYISGVDYKKAFKEFARVLKKKGILLIRLPAFSFLSGGHDAIVHTGHRFTAGEVIDAAQSAGLSVQFSSYANFFLFFPIFLSRILSRFTIPKSDVGEMPLAINWLLEKLLVVEGMIMRRVSLPFGVSLFLVAQK